MKYLGVDYGTKKVGLALSDEAGTMGFPHSIMPNTPKLLETLAALVAKENVGAVVVGESKDFSGRDNPVAKEARALGQELALRAGIPIFFEDERLTSAEARRAPEKTGKSRAPHHFYNTSARTTRFHTSDASSRSNSHGRRKSGGGRALFDASAAALILTSYLSRRHHE